MFNFFTRKLRLLMVGPVAALGLIAFAQAAAANPSSPVQASPSLAGETLQTSFNEVANCTNGPTGASYETTPFEGVATGPYPGTFSETFTMTTDNSGTTTPPGTSGRVLTFTAQFSIDADDGTLITGTK